ncbi:MAG: HEAT repeat domain-containing protein [Methanomicrobiales archaeon]|jgi:HEAT repeat protein|nr:HEAT repeat domain-containing protein [Methanomicrobiales archaeon]
MQEIIQTKREGEETPTEVRELMHVMLTGDTYTGLRAIKAIGDIGAPAVGPLMQALTAVDDDARWTVAMALARIGNGAMEPLIEIIRTAEDGITNPAVWALGEIGDPGVVDPLVTVLQDSHRSECCRCLTAAALLKLGDPAGIARVREAFDLSGEEFAGIAMEAYEGP